VQGLIDRLTKLQAEQEQREAAALKSAAEAMTQKLSKDPFLKQQAIQNEELSALLLELTHLSAKNAAAEPQFACFLAQMFRFGSQFGLQRLGRIFRDREEPGRLFQSMRSILDVYPGIAVKRFGGKGDLLADPFDQIRIGARFDVARQQQSVAFLSSAAARGKQEKKGKNEIPFHDSTSELEPGAGRGATPRP
jgi:hypothetical protein